MDIRRRVLFNLLEEVSNMRLLSVINKRSYRLNYGSTEEIIFHKPCMTGNLLVIGGIFTNSNSSNLNTFMNGSSNGGLYFNKSTRLFTGVNSTNGIKLNLDNSDTDVPAYLYSDRLTISCDYSNGYYINANAMLFEVE